MSYVARTYYLDQSLFLSRLKSSPTNFEPKVFAPFRASRPSGRTHSQLHQLKRKLLRAALEETPETGSCKQLCGAANQAADLAWATSHPLLVFPHLFDEMVAAVRERFQQEQISDAQSSLMSLDVDLRFEDIHSASRESDPTSTAGVLWPPYQTATRGDRTAGQLVGCHTSNEANYAIQSRRSDID
jgi:hypothetical protein